MKTKIKYHLKNKNKNKTKKITGGSINVVKNGKIIISKDFEQHLIYYKKMWENVEKLILHYNDFWQKVYYSEEYSLYKHAIQQYNSICSDGNLCIGMSSAINYKLINGKCIDFTKPNIQKMRKFEKLTTKNESDIFCRFSVHLINLLDDVFKICPTLPFEIMTYRREFRYLDDAIFTAKKGDYYISRNYSSTTINRNSIMQIAYFENAYIYELVKKYDIMQNKKYTEENYDLLNFNERIEKMKKSKGKFKYLGCILFEIILPKLTKGYFIPYSPKISNIIDENTNQYDYHGFFEYEFVLPRNCIFKIIDVKKIGFTFIYSMQLILQHKPKFNSMKTKEHKISETIFDQTYFNKIYKNNKEYEKLFDVNDTTVYFREENPNFDNYYYNFICKIKDKIIKKFYKNKDGTIELFDNKNVNFFMEISDLYYHVSFNTIDNWIENEEFYKKKVADNIYKINNTTFDNNNNVDEQNENLKLYKIYKSLRNKKKKKIFYIFDTQNHNGNIFYELRDELIKTKNGENIIGKVYDIKHSVLINKKIDEQFYHSILFANYKTETYNFKLYDNYFTIDYSIPVEIIIKYFGEVFYFPLDVYDGITFDVKAIKIISVQKIYLTQNVFMYYIEAIAP